MRASLKRRTRRDERGAVLIIVAVFMVVAVVMTAAVVDLGGLRQEKKEVTLSTDAAALAAVSLVDWTDSDIATLNSPAACGDVAVDSSEPGSAGFADVQEVVDDYLLNNGESSPEDCDVVRTGVKQGYVLVSADEVVDYQIATAFGQTSGNVGGVSVAAIGLTAGGGLYPIGLCKFNGLTTIMGASAAPMTFSPPVDLTMDFSNKNCGAGGNHQQIDFLAGPPGQCSAVGQFCYDLGHGGFSQRPVPGTIDSNPGQNWHPYRDYVNPLVNAGHIWIPAAGSANGSGNGATFPLEYYVEVEIKAFRSTGSDKGFDFEVHRVIPFDPAGPPTTFDAANTPPRLCAVTADPADIAESCLSGASSTTPTPAPPGPTPSVCPVQPISPANRDVTVDASGALTSGVAVDVVVDDVTKCGTLSLTAVDGSTEVPATGPSQSGNSFAFTFPAGTQLASGGTTFTLEVREDGSAIDNIATMTTQAVANVPPSASFTGTCNALKCNFTDTSTDGDGTIVSRFWSFGDTTTSTAQDPAKTYGTAGIRTVTLTVTDNEGGTSTATGSAYTIESSNCGNPDRKCTLTAPAGPSRSTYSWSNPSGDPLTGNLQEIAITFPTPSGAEATHVVTLTITPGGQSQQVIVKCTRTGGSSNAKCSPTDP